MTRVEDKHASPDPNKSLSKTPTPLRCNPNNMAISLARLVLRAGGGRHIVRVRNALVRGNNEAMSISSERKSVSWYACGPTVYDDPHLGHARTYISFDVARRILCDMARIPVDFCLGITDVDDKIIERASEYGVSPREIARDYEARFFTDMKALNVRPPTRVLRVTEHIPDIVRVIAELVESNVAYPTADGSVYYKVTNSKQYGLLDSSREQNGQPREEIIEEHEEITEVSKKDCRDFALWKSSCGKLNPDYARWDSPWGVGRPGWDIESTAMIRAVLGDHIDVHSGGTDLRFPHHENELIIANSLQHLCGCDSSTTKEQDKQPERWVNSWLHTGVLKMKGAKMSKSEGNFITIREFLENGGNSDAFRMFCLQHRYGETVEYEEDRIGEAEKFLLQCRRFVISMKRHGNEVLGIENSEARKADFSSKSPSVAPLMDILEKSQEAIEESLVDDFDTPSALSEITKLMTHANTALKERCGATTLICMEIGDLVSNTLSMLGITGFSTSDTETMSPASSKQQQELSRNSRTKSNEVEDELIDTMVMFRGLIREAAAKKDWGRIFATCDEIRSTLRERMGVEIRDGEEQRFTWERLGPGSTSPFTGKKRPVTTEDQSDTSSD